MSFKTVLPPFIGGEEKIYTITWLEDGVPISIVDCIITAEIWWDNCKKITLSEGDGIEILNAAPPAPLPGDDPEPQFQIRLTEERTRRFPIGKGRAYLNIINVPPGQITEIDGPVYLERKL